MSKTERHLAGTTLTIQQLHQAGACAEAVETFRAAFGEAVEVTEALAAQHAATFDWDWAARHLLTPPARAEYDRVTAPALAEYDRVTAPALAEYKRVTAAARAEYHRVRVTALAEYDRVRATAWARVALGTPC